MKTLNEIYTEVMENEELKEKFMTLKSADEMVALVKELGGDATADEIAAFLKENTTKTGELTDAELQQVAGGKGVSWKEALWSTCTAGIGCVVAVIDSATSSGAGTAVEGKGMLCEGTKLVD